MNAPELYALSEGKTCKGKRECHWCGSPCGEAWLHDEPPLIIGVPRSISVARPFSPWICQGCWLWRRTRITIRYLDATTIKDCQSPAKHSWFISGRGGLVVDLAHRAILYSLLTKPPPQFVLALRSPGSKVDVALQMAVVNETADLKVSTPLYFTLDNIKHEFTLYELDDALKRGSEGKSAGTRVLAEMFEGLVEKAKDQPPEKRNAGHQPNLPDARILNKKVPRL